MIYGEPGGAYVLDFRCSRRSCTNSAMYQCSCDARRTRLEKYTYMWPTAMFSAAKTFPGRCHAHQSRFRVLAAEILPPRSASNFIEHPLMSGPPRAQVADKTASLKPIGGDAKSLNAACIPHGNSERWHTLALPTSRTLRLWVDDSARPEYDADIASHASRR